MFVYLWWNTSCFTSSSRNFLDNFSVNSSKTEFNGSIEAFNITKNGKEVATKSYVDSNSGGGTLSCVRRTAGGGGKAIAYCQSGETLTGGGCSCQVDYYVKGYPSGNSYVCDVSYRSGNSVTAYAICCKIE